MPIQLHFTFQSLSRLYVPGHYSIWCQKIVYEDTPIEQIVINHVWLYYFIKILDLLDTVSIYYIRQLLFQFFRVNERSFQERLAHFGNGNIQYNSVTYSLEHTFGILIFAYLLNVTKSAHFAAVCRTCTQSLDVNPLSLYITCHLDSVSNAPSQFHFSSED